MPRPRSMNSCFHLLSKNCIQLKYSDISNKMMQTQYPRSTPSSPPKTRDRPCQSSATTSADTQQAQARRKQIREAQRSYRSRQKSHLASLEARVAQLEDVVGELGQIVETFHDQVIKQSTSLSQPRLRKGVSLLKEETEVHLKRAERSVACELGIRPAVPSSGFQGKIARVFSEPSSCRHTYEPPTNDSSNLVRNPPGEISLTSDFWRLFFSSTNPILPPIQNTSPKFDSNSPTSEIAYPLYDTANETIHYTITPFTQKLFHACAESGHRYLTISSVSDAQMWPEFGLLLEYIPRQEIILYFERVLHMTPCNPVKNSRFPFISLGGAGMQFQAYETVNLLPFQETNGVRVVPSEEQWFDVRDIEGYLVEDRIELGCHDSALYTAQEATMVSSSAQVVPRNMVPVLDEWALIKSLF